MRLSAAQRGKLSKGSFAIPSKAPGSGSYPVNDANHARAALSMVSRYGSPAEKSAVRSKVHAKFPAIGKKAAPKKARKSLTKFYK